MPYSELMIRPMREELTRIGVGVLRTPEQVDETLTRTDLRLRSRQSQTRYRAGSGTQC